MIIIDRELLCAALPYIDATPRDSWVAMAMAVKATLGDAGFALWDDWSQTAANYEARAARACWRSIRHESGVSGGTLLHAAIASGFDLADYLRKHPQSTPPAPIDPARMAQERAAAARADHTLQRQQHAAAAQKASRWWRHAAPVDPQHPYVQARGIQPYGARQWRQLLLLPLQRQGQLCNLQLIAADGQKRFLRGGPVRDAGLWLGDRKAGDCALLCEGWATGCSLHQASQLPVLVALNAANLPRLAAQLAQDPQWQQVIVCGDSDVSGTGQRAARQANHRLGAKGQLRLPDFPPAILAAQPSPPSDFNDQHRLCGLDSVRQTLALTNQPSLPPPAAEGCQQPTPHRRQPAPAVALPVSPPPVASEPRPAATPNPSPPCTPAEGFHLETDGERAGVWYRAGRTPQWLCAPLYIEARTCDPDNQHWGRLLRWQDSAGQPHQWVAPAELACNEAQTLIATLARNGLEVDPSRLARERLVTYILRSPCSALRYQVERIGWHGGQFVLPDQVFGDDGAPALLLLANDHSPVRLHSHGSLDDWRRQIAALAQDNPLLLFVISLALAAPLLRWVSDGGGFHLLGSSSIGKTTLLDAAATVWGAPQDWRHPWRATGNGLEQLCARHHDLLLILDELSQLPLPVAGEMAYLIANGQGKQRANRDGSARKSARWRLLLLSAGELSLSDLLQQHGQVRRAGQAVRLLDLPADAGAGHGVWRQLHGHADGAACTRALKQACLRHYGHAGRALLRQLVQHPGQVTPLLNAIHQRLQQQYLPALSNGQCQRAAQHFALVACGGELATQWGITGWSAGMAEQACGHLLAAWLQARGGNEDSDVIEGLAQVRRFLELHGESRFTPWHDEDRAASGPRTLQRAGFRRQDEQGQWFYVLPQAMRTELCAGYPHRSLLQAMAKRGWLHCPSPQRLLARGRLPGFGTQRLNYYLLTPTVWQDRAV